MKKITFWLLLLVTSWQMSAQFNQNFDAGTTTPAGWSVLNGGGAGTFVFATPGAGTAHSGANVAKIVFNSTAHDDYLVTPQITVVAGTNDRLTFWVRNRNATYVEHFDVKLSTTTAVAASFTTTLVPDTGAPQVWTQMTIDLTAYVGQSVYVGFHAFSTDKHELYFDDIVSDAIPTPCIGTPTAGSVLPLNQNLCSGATPANLVGTGYSNATGITFQWEESNDNGVGDAWANAVGGTGATTATYTPAAFSGTQIYYRLNVTCTASGLSSQTTPVTVSPQINPATQITALAIPSATVGYNQAALSWTNGTGNRRAVFISTSATFADPVNGNAAALTANAVYAGAGQQLILDGTGTSVTVTGLTGGTTYYIKAYEYTRCGSGPYDYFYNVATGTNIGTFTTCGNNTVPTLENFTTFLPGCWMEADNGDLIAGPATFGASSWDVDGLGNVGTTGAFKYNVYTTGANDWMLSPVYTIPASGYELKFDAAVTQFGATTAPTTAWEADDTVEVLVSNGTTNWTVLHTYNSGNLPSNTGTANTIDLDAYAGQNVRFAFRVVEGAANGSADIDFSVDNFEIRLSPVCAEPTSLLVSNLTNVAADVSWTGTSGNYEYVFDQVATNPVGAGTATTATVYNAASLTPQTVYYLHVRSNCGGVFSTWATVSFTTLATPPANDVCANAVALTVGGIFVNNSVIGTTVNATTTSGVVPTCQAASGNDVWYTVTVPASGSVTIETQAQTGTLLTDSILTAFTGACGSLVAAGCDDDAGTGNYSLLTLTGRTPGEVLYVAVWRWTGGGNTQPNGEFKIAAYDASLSNPSFDTANFMAYPNPVKDVLNLSYSKNISTVSVHNLLGQEVMSKNINAPQSKIDMSNLSSGTYLVKVTVDGLVKTVKIVKE